MENNNDTIEEVPQLLSIAEAAKILGTSSIALRRRIARGSAPPVVHPTVGRIAIVRKDLDEWIANLPRNPNRKG